MDSQASGRACPLSPAALFTLPPRRVGFLEKAVGPLWARKAYTFVPSRNLHDGAEHDHDPAVSAAVEGT